MPQLAVAALVVSAGMQLAGTIAQGNAQRASLDNQAAQLHQQAGETLASSERDQQNKLREGAYAESRAEAVQAASGANPDSVTSVTNDKNLAGQSEFGALTALFNGQERAQGMEYQAQNDLIEGKAAHDAGVTGGIAGFAGNMGKAFMASSSPTTASGSNTLFSTYTDPFNKTGFMGYGQSFDPNEYGPYQAMPWQVN